MQRTFPEKIRRTKLRTDRSTIQGTDRENDHSTKPGTIPGEKNNSKTKNTMSKRVFFNRVYAVAATIVLFLLGKFYKELTLFFIDPYALVGLLFVISAFFIAAFFHVKMKLSRKQDRINSYCDKNHLQEEMIYSLRREIKLLKEKKPKEKRLKKGEY